MEVWAESTILATESQRSVREGQSDLLLLLRSGIFFEIYFYTFLVYICIYIYTLNINQIVCIVGSKRLSVRESRGSRSGRGGAIVLSRNSLLFQRHATDRSRQEEQSRVPGTRGTEREREKKKSPRTFQLFDRFQVSFKISSRSFHRSACTSFYHDPCWMEWNQRRCAS